MQTDNRITTVIVKKGQDVIPGKEYLVESTYSGIVCNIGECEEGDLKAFRVTFEGGESFCAPIKKDEREAIRKSIGRRITVKVILTCQSYPIRKKVELC